MPSCYRKNIVPHAVVIRMTAEDVAGVYHLDLRVEDIRVLPPGSPPAPACLWLRPPGDDRVSAIWYWVEEVDGRRSLHSTGCRADDLAGARAWVLRRWVRAAKGARARLAPESIPVCEALADFVAFVDGLALGGSIRPVTHRCYLMSVRRLADCYRDASLMDVVNDGPRKLLDWAGDRDYALNTAIYTANLLKRAINVSMERAGSAFRVTFKAGAFKAATKQPFTPDEIDRILRVCFEHVIYGGDLQVVTAVDAATGERVPVRSSLRRQRAHVPFQRAVPMMIDVANRPTVCCEVTWLDATAPRLDADLGVLHRRGEMTEDDPVKRRLSCVLSPQFLELARPWLEADLSMGYTHVVHDWEGRPLWRIRREAWIRILKDARVPYRKFYALKDTSVQISRSEGVRLHDAAERFSIQPETLTKHYGADFDLGVQIDVAAAHGAQVKWRRAHELAKAREAQAEAARMARAEAMPALPPARRRKAVKRAGRRPQGTDVRALKAKASRPKPTGNSPEALP